MQKDHKKAPNIKLTKEELREIRIEERAELFATIIIGLGVALAAFGAIMLIMRILQ